MESSARLLGHPIHQLLVVFPAGLLTTSAVFDVLHHVADSPTMATVAYYLIAAGVVGALVASPFGLIDWLKIPHGTRARRVGGLHGIGNGVVLLMFIVSLVMRGDAPEAPLLGAQAWSIGGALLALVTAWLGGELVDRLGVGVSDHSGLNAPSSLRDRGGAGTAR